MDNCPFVEELSVKHGDFPFLIYELTLLQYIYIYIFQHVNTSIQFMFIYLYILYGHRPKRFRFFFWKAMFHSCCPHKDTLRQDRAAPGESMRPG